MAIKVGINGFGRIGRVIFRKCFENTNIELSAINDPAVDIEYICYLIKFDSTHGKFRGNIIHKDNVIIINDSKIKVFKERLPSNVPWQTVGVQYVVEASGMFTCLEKASGHLASEKVKRVILTAPSVDIPMIILGVNHDKLKIEHRILSCASSTLYCLAPIIKVLQDSFGVTEGFVTSIHAMTPSLKPLDGLCLRGKHWRDHRSIHQNIIPANTSACKALGKIIPEVKDKLAGVAFRVPIVNVSVLDITIRLNANTSMTDIVKSVENASRTYLQNIIKISNENAVSSDFIGDNYSCILDVDSSLELKPNFFKLICWYENEYSYACRVLDTIFYSERQISNSMLISRKCFRLCTEHVSRKTIEDNRKDAESESSIFNLNDDVFKTKPSHQNRPSILKNQMPLPTSNTKKKYEIFKVWNDDSDISNKRKKYGSFFHYCMDNNSRNINGTKCIKNEGLKSVQKEISKMVIITENLLQKSYSKNNHLESKDNKVSEEKAGDAYRPFIIKSIENNDAHGERKDNMIQTNCSLLKDYGDFDNKVDNESYINVGKEDIKINIGTSKEKTYSYEKMNKAFEMIDVTKNKILNVKLSTNNEANRIKKCVHKSNIAQITDKIVTDDLLLKYGAPNISNIDLKAPIKGLTEQPSTNDMNKLSDRFIHRNISSEITGEDNEKVFSNITKDGFGSQLCSKKGTCSIQNSQCEHDEAEEKHSLKKLAEGRNKNDDLHLIDKELKKRKIIIIESDTNSNMSSINTNQLSPVIERCETNMNIQVLNDLNRLTIENNISNELLQHESFRNILTLTHDTGKRKKQDIFDKLDSVSATDSNDSFDINERKSQVIHITDLTNSLEDLSRLDKICRIIEISDELSDELFSALNKNKIFDGENKQWSFKDLCERIKLDEFCNKVFGETSI